jgi:hypothetical protein
MKKTKKIGLSNKEFKELFDKLFSEYYIGLQQAYTRREQTEKDIAYFTRMLNYINNKYSKKVVK